MRKRFSRLLALVVCATLCLPCVPSFEPEEVVAYVSDGPSGSHTTVTPPSPSSGSTIEVVTPTPPPSYIPPSQPAPPDPTPTPTPDPAPSGGEGEGSGSGEGEGSGEGGHPSGPTGPTGPSDDYPSYGGYPIIIGGGCNCNHEEYSTYHPKITILHNANANLVEYDNEEVYYIPTLDELPFNLRDTAMNITDKNGNNHKFALVYDGLFDAEAKLVNPERTQNFDSEDGEQKEPNYAEAHTSKTVYASKYNDQALQTIGYDLLLKSEAVNMKFNENGDIDISYTAKHAGEDPLTGQVAIMDLYKSVGIFEYVVRMAFGTDPDFDANSSPILNEIDFLTSKDEVHGIDVSEAKGFVGVTRTQPKLYWDRYMKDGISTGLQTCDYDNLSTIYHVSTPVMSRSTTVTAAQFCNLAVAIMNLYGEPALTEEDLAKFEFVHGSLLLGMNNVSDVERRCIEYLVCKGIIDAKTVNNIQWDETVSLLPKSSSDYNYVLAWLGRIANPDTRLALPDIEYIDPQLKAAGYSPAYVNFNDIYNYTEARENNMVNTRDFLLEFKPVGTDPTQVRNAKFIHYNRTGGTFTHKGEVKPETTENTGPSGEESSSEEPSGEESSDEKPALENEPKMLSSPGDTESVEFGTEVTLPEEVDTSQPSAEDEIDYTESDASLYVLDTNDIVISGMKAATSPNTIDEKHPYYYLGTEIHYVKDESTNVVNKKYYYHFRILSSKCGSGFTPKVKLSKDYRGENTINLCTVTSEKDEETNEESYVVQSESKSSAPLLSVSNGSGGVYDLNEDETDFESPKDFASAGFDASYRDSSSEPLKVAKTADDYVVIQLYATQKKLNKFFEFDKANATDYNWRYDTSLNWKNIFRDNKFITGESLSIDRDSKTFVTIASVESESKQGRYLVEFLTKDPDKVKSSLFITGRKATIATQEAKGYVRYDSGTGSANLMLSLTYLYSNGHVRAYNEVSDGVLILTTEDKGNVTINTVNRTIIVGDTIYSISDAIDNQASKRQYTSNYDKDPLFVRVDDDIYISYRAFMGWASTMSFVRQRTGAVTVVMSDSVENAVTETKTLRVNISFPGTQVFVRGVKFKWGKKNLTGIPLTSSYVLAPYMLVHTNELRFDYLFVWHRQGITLDDGGDPIMFPADADAKNRDEFKNLTGVDVSKVGSEYYLVRYVLDKYSKTMGKKGATSLPGFYYIHSEIKHPNDKSTADAGWVYVPVRSSNGILDAAQKYARGPIYVKDDVDVQSRKQNQVSYPLPIMAVKTDHGTHYYDVNYNLCKESGASTYLPIGVMPGSYANSKTELVRMNVDSHSEYTGVTGSSYVVDTAPAGLFAQLKCLGTAKASDLKESALFYGTSRVYVSNGKIVLADKTTSIDVDSEAVCTYLSLSSATTYVITQSNGNISKLLNSLETVINKTLTDPSSLVDWGQYKFNRLVQNMDAWSTVVLIFILNILPRVAMLLFFTLMLLALIKDVKPWRMFCNRCFDVYKFLTLGHQSVETIDIKRTVVVSMFCLALFGMILDGQLFNFIIFISKFIVAFYQH